MTNLRPRSDILFARDKAMSIKIPNKDLFFACAFYFAYTGGVGFISPFINLFYVSLGLRGTQIGTIGSLSAIVGLVVSPIVMTEIKKLPQARTILQLSLVFGAMGYFLLGQQSLFPFILVIVFFNTLIMAGIMPTSDSMAVAVAQDAGTGYGSVRVWASVGWIVTVLSSGWLIQRFGFGAGFTGVTLIWILGAGLVLFIPSHYFVARKDIELSKPSLRAAFNHILHDRTLLGFAIAIIFIGFLNNGVGQFENVFLSEAGRFKTIDLGRRDSECDRGTSIHDLRGRIRASRGCTSGHDPCACDDRDTTRHSSDISLYCYHHDHPLYRRSILQLLYNFLHGFD